ncbi:MAG: hypothetical protein OEU26_13445 [Candidatus Tectomicrobia bacterium]|nr:hypothetical protein [Candidatus Tectomicrobia bacterium]
MPDLQLTNNQAVPVMVALEADYPVDDIAVTLSSGGKAFIQAKRSVNLAVSPTAEFFHVVQQWKNAVNHTNFNLTTDRLVLAVQNPSQPIRHLRSALIRYKAEASGAYTTKEHKALMKLKGLLSDLSDEHRDRLLRSACIVILALEEDGISDAGVAEELLDGSVVAPGQGRQAWRELKRLASDMAQRREGHSIDGWMDVLREAEFTLISDVEASASAKREAIRLAEVLYRQRIVEHASVIDLRGLGSTLPPLPAQEVLSPIRVVPDDYKTKKTQRTRMHGQSILGAIRRRGRTLLLGLPGGGKTTAMWTAASHWAQCFSWPLPIFGDLKGLLREVKQLSPLDNLIEFATRDLDSQERKLMAERIWEYAKSGMLTIFLDGLDETRERRVEMVRYIERLLSQVHQDTEIIVSTRDSGYAQAHTLGFKELRLLSPAHMTQMLRHILKNQVAADPSIQEQDRGQWVNVRMSWIEDMLKRDRHLTETPLLPILIGLLAGQSDQSILPRTRAQILSHVIDNLAQQWEIIERRQSEFQMGSLTVSEVSNALLDAFECVGYHLVSKPEVTSQEAVQAIAAIFQDRWGMPRGRAETAASQSLSFWDEAGIIVATGPQEMLISRVQLFSEIAAARYIMKLPQDKQHDVLWALLNEDTGHESAVLAAGLSSEVATGLVEFAVAEGSLTWGLLAARSMSEGAALSAPALEKLVNLLIRYLQDDSQRAWDVAKVIVRLPAPDKQQEQVIATLRDHMANSYRVLAQALASIYWGRPRVDLIREALRAGPLRRRDFLVDEGSRSLTVNDLRSMAVDDGFNSLVELAAERLLNKHPELASDIAAGALRSSGDTSVRVSCRLLEHGFSDLVKDILGKDIHEVVDQHMADSKGWDQKVDNFLHLIVLHPITFLGMPIDLPLVNRRRLDDLVDFIATLRYVELPEYELEGALASQPDSLRCILEAVTILGGFDANILASEAQLVLEEWDQQGHHEMRTLLFDDGKKVVLTRWDSVRDIHEMESRLVEVLGDESFWLAVVAATALMEAPIPDRVVQDIEPRLSQFNLKNRDLAAGVIACLEPTPQRVSTWITDTDCILRRVAARLQAALFVHTLIPLEDIAFTLSDPEAGVRESVLEGLQGANLPDTLIARIREVVNDPGEIWICERCGHMNAGTLRSCETCRIVGPDPQKAAKSLLAAITL